MKKGITYIYIGLFVITALLLFGIYFHTMNFFQQEDVIRVATFTTPEGKDNLKYRMLADDDPRLYSFEAQIPGEEFKKIEDDLYKIMVYRLAGNWYRIYFNDVLVGSLGNLRDNRSNIWNAFRVYDLDSDLIKDSNKLTVEVYATYELGFLSYPVTIGGVDLANRALNWFHFILEILNFIVISILIFAFILFLFLFSMSRKVRREYLLYSLAAVMMAVSIFDCITIYHLPVSTLLFKKIVFSGIYLANIFISLALYNQFKVKFNFIMAYILLPCLVYVNVFINDIVFLFKVFSYTNILVFFNILGWIYTGFKNFKESIYARIILTGSVILLVFSGIDIYIQITGRQSVLNMYTYGVLVFAFSVSLLVVVDYIELQGKIIYERKKSSLMYQKAIRDGMTGIYNHQYIAATLEETNDPFYLIMFDIDNFKKINDTYGHQIGDFVLKKLVRGVKRRLGHKAIFGRYGGDEFVIISFNPNKKLVEEIKEVIEEPMVTPQGQKLKITVSMGVYRAKKGEESEKVLYRADQALYRAKEKGKARIEFYREELEEKGLL